jgi:hypothetical protein
MTGQPTKGRGGRPGLSRTVWTVAGALVFGSIVFYAWVGIHGEHKKAEWWGMMGSSSAPFAALFSAGAFIALLWTIHLQMQASHDQAESTTKQLKLMGNQVAEFARAADAQRALADQQEKLTVEQRIANHEARLARLAQHANTIATMDMSLGILAAASLLADGNLDQRKDISDEMRNRRQAIGNRIHLELKAEAALALAVNREQLDEVWRQWVRESGPVAGEEKS